MTVEKLAEILKTLPPKAKVYFVEYSGCSECNPEAMPSYHEVEAIELQPRGHYPSDDLTNIVKIS